MSIFKTKVEQHEKIDVISIIDEEIQGMYRKDIKHEDYTLCYNMNLLLWLWCNMRGGNKGDFVYWLYGYMKEVPDVLGLKDEYVTNETGIRSRKNKVNELLNYEITNFKEIDRCGLTVTMAELKTYRLIDTTDEHIRNSARLAYVNKRLLELRKCDKNDELSTYEEHAEYLKKYKTTTDRVFIEEQVRIEKALVKAYNDFNIFDYNNLRHKGRVRVLYTAICNIKCNCGLPSENLTQLIMSWSSALDLKELDEVLAIKTKEGVAALKDLNDLKNKMERSLILIKAAICRVEYNNEK